MGEEPKFRKNRFKTEAIVMLAVPLVIIALGVILLYVYSSILG